MTLTETPRQQNTNILSYARELTKLIKNGHHSHRASDAELLIKQLTDELDAHVDEENAYLLPFLFQHPNERVRDTARRSQNRLNEIAPQIKRWSQAWRASQIENHPDAFFDDTRQVFIHLKAHIDAENTHLFPLVELEK